ncbi:amidohydrolase [Kocuria rosea]|uniref:amidohydrolase n=1 Tax=Kocuria rosea TaxID=1275 RepID=UPI002041EFFA|nr:amidohydrolase [Kocuria rosea]MCM3688661.1 amidohydrolase [Kocuria rosea]
MTGPIVLTGGTIHLDARGSSAEAVGVREGSVVAAGTLEEVTAALPGAHRADLEGRTVVPGLVESHVHPIFFGLTEAWVDERSPRRRSVPEIVDALRDALPGVADGEWLRGWGYDHTALAEGRHPTRDELDQVSTDVPVVLAHVTAHLLVANSRALELAGIRDDTPDPAGGRFVRDDAGRLTGLVQELGAVAAVLAAVPPPAPEDLTAAAQRALALAASRGMTTVHDLATGFFAGSAELDAWEALDAAGRVPVRVAAYLRGDLLPAFLASRQFGTGEMFRVHGAKFWADGSIQGLTAALRAPYACAHDVTGELLLTREELVHLVTTVDAAGGQAAVHANGDRALSTVVEAFAAVRAEGCRRGGRHRVEHLQMASPEDLAALAAAGGVASVFVNHVYWWGDRHRDVFLGEERAARIDPLADVAASGLHFGLHSDCPVTPMDALRTLWTAVTRRTSGGAVLGPEQRLTPARALHALTADSAWLIGTESRSGTLHPGMDADLAVLETDVLAADPEELEHVEVAGTMVGGNWVFGGV